MFLCFQILHSLEKGSQTKKLILNLTDILYILNISKNSRETVLPRLSLTCGLDIKTMIWKHGSVTHLKCAVSSRHPCFSCFLSLISVACSALMCGYRLMSVLESIVCRPIAGHETIGF